MPPAAPTAALPLVLLHSCTSMFAVTKSSPWFALLRRRQCTRPGAPLRCLDCCEMCWGAARGYDQIYQGCHSFPPLLFAVTVQALNNTSDAAGAG